MSCREEKSSLGAALSAVSPEEVRGHFEHADLGPAHGGDGQVVSHLQGLGVAGQLAGGLYGVHLGGAFFGESMFHHVTDASKVALAMLVDRLVRHGFELLDVQWLTRKLALYGLDAPRGAGNMTKIVSGKQLWNYDNLEPAEKKLVL